MSSKIRVTNDKVVVKIYDSDKQMKVTSEGGILTSNVLKPTMDACQIGECVEVGKNINYKNGEYIVFNWAVENTDETFIERDETGEYRYVNERQIYGTLKINKQTKYSHIQPKKGYVLAEPLDDYDFELTKTIFQIPISAINSQDVRAKKMGLKIGEWIICLDYGAIPITVKRKLFFFINIENIMFINDGQHRISINRKRSSELIRMASRKEMVQLN